jgi:(R,R)-butanediol dehydrogenase/meso-butanediol dehydrogenase/diacetyl reductase
MKTVQVTGPGTTAVLDIEQPTAGPRDVLVKMKACGICGSDHMYTTYGGIPPRQGATPLGHEPAGEVVEVGAEVDGVAIGDHVVINVMATVDGLLGSGGAQGGFSEFIVLKEARAGVQFRVVPSDIPWEVVALNEPMAVARHATNRTGSKPGDKVAVFGAGPIGLGALLGFKARGAAHVVVVDVVPNRLEKALQIGADAVINSAEEDVAARLIELHGVAPQVVGVRGERPATDVYLDAAGVPAVIATATAAARQGATLGVVAVHKKPIELDLGALLTTELTLVLSMGYPTEIFEVTDDIIANWRLYELIISDRIPFARIHEALELAATPGAADKVVVTFD